MVEGLPEHPVGCHRGSWGTSVSFGEANKELHGENGTKQARCEVHLDVAKGTGGQWIGETAVQPIIFKIELKRIHMRTEECTPAPSVGPCRIDLAISTTCNTHQHTTRFEYPCGAKRLIVPLHVVVLSDDTWHTPWLW